MSVHEGFTGWNLAPDGLSPRRGLRQICSREGLILGWAIGCLFLLHRFGRTPFFRQHLAPFFSDWPEPTLQPYLWSSFGSVTTRMLLPVFLIVVLLRERPRDFGYRLAPLGKFGWVYAALLLFMVPVLWTVAGTDAFQHKYPFWEGTTRSWRLFLVYEARYFFIFLSGESFWRGFLVFGLFRRFGWHALSISMVPYVMVHYGKPPIETLGAVVTAYVLGYLAIRHRSFWLGVVLHFSVAFLMDFFALLRSGRLPDAW